VKALWLMEEHDQRIRARRYSVEDPNGPQILSEVFSGWRGFVAAVERFKGDLMKRSWSFGVTGRVLRSNGQLAARAFELSRTAAQPADVGDTVCDLGIPHVLFCLRGVADIEGGIPTSSRSGVVAFHSPPLDCG